jgi:signal transduction histidine kinase
VVQGRKVFDNLKGNAEQQSTSQLKLKEEYRQKTEGDVAELASPRARRLEQNYEAELALVDEDEVSPLTGFSSEVDPFVVRSIDDHHFVMLRNVWRDQRRVIQGALINKTELYTALIQKPFTDATISASADLSLKYPGMQISHYTGGRSYRPGENIAGTLLYQRSLSVPLNDLDLVFSFRHMPLSTGGILVGFTGGTLVILLLAGFALLYRTGTAQIALGEQQQDFVSAVSHELKTPLTSIRMYGEILKAGWAPEEKKREYYRYIYDESERLTRLINNVLRLARISHNGTDLAIERTSLSELMDLTRSKIISSIEAAGFVLVEEHLEEDVWVDVDKDAFVQIVINLVDNALKFSRDGSPPQIHLASRRIDEVVEISVRDYGPGVPPEQMRKIFKLFYRTERELTRETVGTGIGLALVTDLTTAMGGRVDVVNRDPGAEFRLRLPCTQCPVLLIR